MGLLLHLLSSEDLEQILKRYCWLYNHHVPQKALHHKTPIATMKEWQEKSPDLFYKNVTNHAGPDMINIHDSLTGTTYF